MTESATLDAAAPLPQQVVLRLTGREAQALFDLSLEGALAMRGAGREMPVGSRRALGHLHATLAGPEAPARERLLRWFDE